jgi:hypothetical protein
MIKKGKLPPINIKYITAALSLLISGDPFNRKYGNIK